MALCEARQISLRELYDYALWAKGRIRHIYLHWTGGRYDQCFDDYHINIGEKGEIFLTCDEFMDYKEHTWYRNSGAIGIALCCCYKADPGDAKRDELPHIDFGPFAPTQEQIESLAMVVATITEAMDMDINEDTVMTHEEAAVLDGYGPGSGDVSTKWDLWYLPDLPETKELRPGGRVLRGKSIWYRSKLY